MFLQFLNRILKIFQQKADSIVIICYKIINYNKKKSKVYHLIKVQVLQILAYLDKNHIFKKITLKMKVNVK